MTTAFIVVDGERHGQDCLTPASFSPGVAALNQSILASPGFSISSTQQDNSGQVDAVNVISAQALAALPASRWEPEGVLCPLTLELPEHLPFPYRAIYQACRDITSLRRRVADSLGYATGTGCLWLPLVLTRKGPLYGEVIAVQHDPDKTELYPSGYYQPVHLPDRWRQPLYRLGQWLSRSLKLLPSVYLVQFGFEGEAVCFDRLLPFPAEPAIASLGIQTPDLFTCYWRCLAHQPILDLVITSSNYQVYQPVSSALTSGNP
ncbi:hypothetical protein IQ268_00600 [Oculatella sp. LEGE 06141]|uniref:hypothetical protein n=1 Tax=Oculatella sp. LEGE 06141 TaxID=1828648 RepID=UPI001882985F|nr:hypothetical protein [Oculatella sp. LEGE 06141]MBE9177073.1 hypothetical protein [Oculatella sp. LEGE 06141]